MATTADSTVATNHSSDPVIPREVYPPTSPRQGESYLSPVPVNGSGAFSGNAYVELHFKPHGPETVAPTPNYYYSNPQVLPTGPNALHYQFAWFREDNSGGGFTDWFDTGWFYVRTPPE
ncbi:hypothetical protein J3D47_001627 [Pseudomonas laurylsulfativorans]|uniref:hypothetical protein n=1 Tax=Pseudomonas laurylsulfativorans TaxID=1943631 RepID=UPI0020A1E66C|nr:hypothetical protein [Pseudomonas laurylsulfativorans]MCP1417384.1 hypothetical protein [Pseudomonas laurylsulfativorans]